ncbi:phenylalanine--tRNA ligase subunit beta [Portibacter lacus]|uniref:Phenylalanine--tRNA ligase beta subunit n=1 Tax=Portibacter lacus TaxID=1099794 RepID=A0AA37SUQ1_9BACT|nr:phenylalanine--tRNA ligase subunit beta [Portibacter lacus]GLR18558.1 phenylalanine--tRNA ligase beta subunit [Portibacter lacus]
MKISLNWLKQYIILEQSPEEISEILTAIGLEVEGMEEIETIKGGLEGIKVGHVIECGKHPNADKLSLTKVDIGEAEAIQIVCGAPNVAKNQKVLVATVGTTLYAPDGEAWKIKAGKIRGEVSNGMICAEDEVGLGESHDGIMVLPEDTKVGQWAKELFEINNDIVYEIGLTPNRSDATSHIGVAEDLAAYLKVNTDHDGKITYPDFSAFKEGSGDGGIKVSLIDENGAPRYSGVKIENIVIKESPDWLKNNLKAIGINPKNNVVDITNFVLHEMGQPLHAFDAEKIAGNHIKVQTLAEGATFVDLDGKERTLHPEDVMICDGNDQGMCIGGVFGGLDSGVSDTTKSIFLESAYFNPKSIRKTSTRHLLRTDAAVTFEKGSNPNSTVTALKRAAQLMVEYADAKIASEIIDLYPQKIEPKEIPVKYSNINRLIGDDISRENVNNILEALHIDIISENDDSIIVKIPTNKADVLREADVIEEVLRIYGFNKVSIPEKVVSNISYKPKPNKPALRNKAADLLCGFGFNEMMAVSLNQAKYYEASEQDKLVYINNTSNIHLNVMRADMVHSALEAVEYNVNRQVNDLKLFEFGRVYWKEGEEIKEKEQLSITLSGSLYKESWMYSAKIENQGFYYVKSAVNQLLESLGVNSFQVSEIENEHYLYGIKYHRGPKVIAEIGVLHPKLSGKMGVKQEVVFGELDWNEVVKAGAKNKIQSSVISKYPKVRRDLALVVGDHVKFSDVESIAKKTDKRILKEVNLFDVYKNDEQLGEGKKSYAVSFEFQELDKTLKDKEVDKVMKSMMDKFEKNLGAFIRK